MERKERRKEGRTREIASWLSPDIKMNSVLIKLAISSNRYNAKRRHWRKTRIGI